MLDFWLVWRFAVCTQIICHCSKAHGINPVSIKPDIVISAVYQVICLCHVLDGYNIISWLWLTFCHHFTSELPVFACFTKCCTLYVYCTLETVSVIVEPVCRPMLTRQMLTTPIKSRANAHKCVFGRGELRDPAREARDSESWVSPACQSPIGWSPSAWSSLDTYLARSALVENHHRVIAATLRPPLWRPVGRLRTARLRTIDEDVQPWNFRVHTARRKVRYRDTWQQVVSTAMHC